MALITYTGSKKVWVNVMHAYMHTSMMSPGSGMWNATSQYEIGKMRPPQCHECQKDFSIKASWKGLIT